MHAESEFLTRFLFWVTGCPKIVINHRHFLPKLANWQFSMFCAKIFYWLKMEINGLKMVPIVIFARWVRILADYFDLSYARLSHIFSIYSLYGTVHMTVFLVLYVIYFFNWDKWAKNGTHSNFCTLNPNFKSDFHFELQGVPQFSSIAGNN